jgi:hypothetical protein
VFRRFCAAAAVACAVALIGPGIAFAQEGGDFEAYGGFSYLFADVGGTFSDANGPGFSGGFAFFFDDWLGLGGEVGYSSAPLDLPVIQIFPVPEMEFDQWTLLFGPRFRISQTDRFRVGALAMAGIARGSIDIDFDDDGFQLQVPGGQEILLSVIDFEATSFAAAFGVHFDLRIDDRIVWRLVEPVVLITAYGNDTQGHFRLSSGLAFDF